MEKLIYYKDNRIQIVSISEEEEKYIKSVLDYNCFAFSHKPEYNNDIIELDNVYYRVRSKNTIRAIERHTKVRLLMYNYKPLFTLRGVNYE